MAWVMMPAGSHVKLNDPSVPGRMLLDGLREAHSLRDGAERVGVAACSNCFLAEDAAGECLAFVDDAAAGAADSHGGENKVGSLNCVNHVGRGSSPSGGSYSRAG